MRGKWRLVYADLFCGPGVSIERKSRQEYLGSPLLASARSEFEALFFNDIDRPSIEALRKRLPTSAHAKALLENQDCNSIAAQAREFLYPVNVREQTLGLGVIDPTAYQIDLTTLAELTRNVKMDLIITYMTDHLRRFANTPVFRRPVGRFLGDPNWWQQIVGQDEPTTYYRLLQMYHQQLRQIGYKHFSEPVAIRNSNRKVLYHIVFASRHPLGADFAKKISQRNVSGQRRLF